MSPSISYGACARVDVFFILGLLFCTAVTMCISLPTVEAALARVFGITPSFGLEIAILFVSALLAGVTVYLGLKKGIKRLSDINVVIALAMVAYGALVGPTSSTTARSGPWRRACWRSGCWQWAALRWRRFSAISPARSWRSPPSSSRPAG
ncbi:BCCT family transporter [Bilophila wadsworthia]|uniref:BCCT family transporter n=1 Tax=Bilophila wadsworthia TaxID=35833 RepID=UPI0034CD4CE6